MELRHLRTFLAIAEEGSVTAAATRLYMTQPALTRQIANLETSLDVLLFERRPTGMALTDAGHRLTRQAARLLADADALVDEFRSDAAMVNGRLNIASPEEALGPLTPIVLSAFGAAFPNVDVHLDEGCEFQAIENLDQVRSSAHDLALWGTTTSCDELRSHEVYREEVMIAASHASPWAAAAEPIEATELLEETFLDLGAFIRRWTGEIYLEDFRNGARTRVNPEASGAAEDSFALVADGRAVIGMTPSTEVPDDVVLMPLRERPTVGIGVIHSHRTANPYVRPFTQIATEVGRRLWHLVDGAEAPAA